MFRISHFMRELAAAERDGAFAAPRRAARRARW